METAANNGAFFCFLFQVSVTRGPDGIQEVVLMGCVKSKSI